MASNIKSIHYMISMPQLLYIYIYKQCYLVIYIGKLNYSRSVHTKKKITPKIKLRADNYHFFSFDKYSSSTAGLASTASVCSDYQGRRTAISELNIGTWETLDQDPAKLQRWKMETAEVRYSICYTMFVVYTFSTL